jgi:hypothetical protein
MPLATSFQKQFLMRVITGRHKLAKAFTKTNFLQKNKTKKWKHYTLRKKRQIRNIK